MKCFTPTLIAIAMTASLAACQATNPSQQATNTVAAQQAVTVIKSQSDHRDYRYVTLENGLKALLISDPNTDKSAAAMDVSVGAYHAPKDREGLLHFLEHMLFLGTEKYPVAGEYSEYLKKNGGGSNAYTSLENTNYFFDVKNDAYDEALDRFAQFFIAPTMDPKFVDREKNAVDSEYSLKIKDEFRRIREASRQAVNPDHPQRLFSVGNLDTLADRGDDKVYDDLIKAYKRHYSAHRMALVVLSNQPLDALESSVKEKFSAIANNGLPKPKLSRDFLTEKEKGTRVHIDALRDTRQLMLQFPISDPQQYQLTKPIGIVSHLLGHKGNNSLYQSLNNQGLIESMYAYDRDHDAMDVYTISLELTEKGLKQVDDIVEQVFAYIDLVKQKGVSQAYYEEIKKIAKIDFAFQEQVSPMRTVSSLAPQLQSTPATHILNAYYEYQQFDAKTTHKFLNELSPFNMQQLLVAPDLTTNKTEPLYNVDYSVNKLPKSSLTRWSKAKANDNLQLPKLNPFIAENTDLLPKESSGKPTLAMSGTGIEMWHMQDTSFGIPKASMYMRLESPHARSSIENRAKVALVEKLLEDKLNAFGYDAKLAGLSYNVFASEKGIGYAINGFNDKQADLINVLNKTIAKFDIDKNKFDLLKASLLRDWKNAALARPIDQVFDRQEREFGEDPFSEKMLAAALEPVTFSDLKQFMHQLLSEVRINALSHGNVSQDEAIALAKNLKETFLTKKIAAKTEQVVRHVEPGTVIINEMDINHDDSALVISYPSDHSMKGNVSSRMIAQVLSAKYYHSMRTEQQLGYVVGTFSGEFSTLPALNFYVQSSKVGPVALQKHIDTFIAEQFDQLKTMSAEEFEQHKAGLLSKINRKDKNLSERTRRLWNQMVDGYTQFDKRAQLTAGIKAMTKEDLIADYNQLLIQPSKKRVITRNFGQAHQDGDYQHASQDKQVCRQEQCWTIL
ncbi:insulinase family protein [Thalassotalea fusca]